MRIQAVVYSKNRLSLSGNLMTPLKEPLVGVRPEADELAATNLQSVNLIVMYLFASKSVMLTSPEKSPC